MGTSTVIGRELKRLQQHAEQIRNDEHAAVSLEVGENVRQGDLYIVRLSGLPNGLRTRTSRQLAQGETQGSRHMLEGQAEVYDAEVPEVIDRLRRDAGADVRDYQVGPVFRLPAGGATVTHPEHGDRTLREAGDYAVVYQRSLTADEQEERARD